MRGSVSGAGDHTSRAPVRCRQQGGLPDAGHASFHHSAAALAAAVDQVGRHIYLALAPEQEGHCHLAATISVTQP